MRLYPLGKEKDVFNAVLNSTDFNVKSILVVLLICFAVILISDGKTVLSINL